jgi:PAS domain S-box-containing protein
MTPQQPSAAAHGQLPKQDASGTIEEPASPGPEFHKALCEVLEGTAGETGRLFFQALVRHLAVNFGVQYAVVAQVTDRVRARALAYWDRDRLGDDLEEDITGTPCAELVAGGVVFHPTGVSRLFPSATSLVGRGIDSYLAVALPTGAGNSQLNGYLAVFDVRSMSASPWHAFLLRIFARRAAAELERVHADEQLGASEANYRDLFEHAPTPYLIVAADGRIVRVNRRVTEFLGYSDAELVGSMLTAFLPDTPAGLARGMELRRKHQAGEAVSGQELELRRKDGRPLWIKMWQEPGKSTDGTSGAGRMFFVDITERVLADQRSRLQAQTVYLQEEIKTNYDFEQIIGRSPPLLAVLADVSRVAATDASVLITGETGTGKELIARAIHFASRRKEKPLVKVNCAALPAGLVESELFGHEMGAFSGAIAKRLGRFELADGGTIFLDEVGELPTEAQAKLLRVLQEREFDRVGGNAPVRVDVRVIAATNRNPTRMVQEKTLRQDLYFRLNVFPVHLPPLRQRKDDIPLLVSFLVRKFAVRIGKHITGVTERTLQRLQEYSWPGNIRELENVMERAVILATGTQLDITEDLLPTPQAASESQRVSALAAVAAEDAPASTPPALRTMCEVEREHILSVLRQTNWVIAGPRGAAKILGLHPNTLGNRMKKLGISRQPP